MFSGIVEEFATVTSIVKEQENIHFTFTEISHTYILI